MSVTYSEPRQKSMMKLSAKKFTAKSFIIDIWQGSKYASGLWMPEKKHFLEILKIHNQVEGWYLF